MKPDSHPLTIFYYLPVSGGIIQSNLDFKNAYIPLVIFSEVITLT